MKENLSDVLTRNQKLSIALARQDADNAQTRLEGLSCRLEDQMEELDKDSPEYEALDEAREILADVAARLEEHVGALLELCPEMENVEFDVHNNITDKNGKVIETIKYTMADGDSWVKCEQ